METRILLIGGSAGSINVLMQVLPFIETDISFPIVIVLHRKPHPQSALDDLLATSTQIPVLEAEDKTELEIGKIYLVPPDYHLLFENESIISLDASEKINYSRPSIDVTFESAARVFGSKACALLLSGGNGDGVEGLRNISLHHGKIFVQDPLTAEVDYMPRKAVETLTELVILPPKLMAKYINELKKLQNEQ
ncbi:chemotaxis protein CheB [Moheibacter sediminis]|uniref:protein-glutamate methylesterase n=1 Tax=Moheibacter sediminis TaxID=1434700 RepID=A0A1W2AZN1_9FLAO|nr:chemotaxis protein CheB [Moheibacter sediminis]SMC66146.1 CheB methylesterase [Moheibacter sediminis]